MEASILHLKSSYGHRTYTALIRRWYYIHIHVEERSSCLSYTFTNKRVTYSRDQIMRKLVVS